MASFGTPFTRVHWTSGPPCGQGCKTSLGVARRGETFNSLPFASISFHFDPFREELEGFTLILAFAGNDGIGVLDSSLRWSICVVSQANAAAGGLLLNAVPRRAMAFSNNNNLRITATSATFPAFPRSRKPR